MRMREVAALSGLSASTLRKYEALGLVLPYKESSGHRLYSQQDIAWLLLLRTYFERTGRTPSSLGDLLAIVPFQDIRHAVLGEPCAVRNTDSVCWLVHADDPAWRRKCRDCPGYQQKDRSLEFLRHFRVIPRLKG